MEGEGKKEEEISKKIIHTYPLIKVCDMVDEMRGEAMELCVTACEKHASNNEMAAKMIKENMDKKFGPSWHAIVEREIISWRIHSALSKGQFNAHKTALLLESSYMWVWQGDNKYSKT